MTLEEFFFDTPIYTKIEINNAEIFKTFQAITDNYHKEEFEGFNPWSKIESTFVVITDIQGNSSDRYTKEGGYGTVKIKCKRTDDIFWFFFLVVSVSWRHHIYQLYVQ